jgi:hypothetical protein
MTGKVPPKGKEEMKGGKKAIPPNPPKNGRPGAKGTTKPVDKKEDMKAKMERLRNLKKK